MTIRPRVRREAVSPARCRPTIERAEPRRLFAVGLSGGVLTVTGTDADESYRVDIIRDPINTGPEPGPSPSAEVSLNGVVVGSFDPTQITSVVANLGGGADSITVSVDYSQTSPTPVSVDGGDGDDRLYGDAGDDAISGATGKDVVYGGDGQDVATHDEHDRIVREIELLT